MTRTNWTPSKAPYPPARRSDASTTYASAKHGKVTVPEPYDWLETPPSQSEETAAWTKAQAAYTDAFLAECGDKEAFKKRLEQNWDYVRTSAPSHKRDGRYYYSYNAGLAPQSVIYRATREEIDAVHGTSQKEPVGELFFDTNVLSDDGTVALSLTAFSHTGKYVTYGLSVSGSDWIKLYVRPTDAPLVSNDGTEGGAGRLADVIENVKFSSAVWTHDDQGFFYQRYPAVSHEDKGTETDANQDAELYYHRLGTPQSDDVLVIARDAATPSSMWHPTVTDDGKWVLLENSKDTDTKQRFYLAPLEGQTIGASMRWIPISTEFKYTLGYLGNDGNRFYFITNKDAPNYRVVALDVDPAQAVATEHVAELTGANDAFVDLVAEDSKAIVTSAKIVDQNKLLVLVSRDVKDELWLHDLEGKQITRLLPDLVGTVGQVAGLREDREVFVLTVSFSNPGTVHRIAWQGEPSKVEGPTSVEVYSATHVAGIRPEEYTSTQIFVPSKDGTEIPVFLTYPKSMPLDGSAPALVYFYGGFNIPLNPVFSPSMMTWVASYGGILAFVNARGGGEYGDKWHEAGMLFNKQNVFDDVMAATQHLHEHKYAAKGKITIMGGSNGGLGVAAVANQCTDASGIGAAIADVGVHDMLKFPLWTIGKAWAADYGNPQEDGAAFDYNYAYSPLHNVTQKVYPTMILACADHDDRVVPAHSFKLAAELQHQRKDNPNPLLLRVELQAGHGAGKSTQKRIDEASEKFAIVARMLGLSLAKGSAL
ncbi:prolyl oligopeptidase [Malassezia japonica]|uniref:Prolyl endopeptidase n=1 Tax=Malassezia japonica TaxID=223818 RepID=A0AAF0F4I2_9BASI|nr:prolyl oligopeptidase [Malassezia japonica]WFD38242.1 prolyl oligopeptidase [Malassezia japonica]